MKEIIEKVIKENTATNIVEKVLNIFNIKKEKDGRK